MAAAMALSICMPQVKRKCRLSRLCTMRTLIPVCAPRQPDFHMYHDTMMDLVFVRPHLSTVFFLCPHQSSSNKLERRANDTLVTLAHHGLAAWGSAVSVKRSMMARSCYGDGETLGTFIRYEVYQSSNTAISFFLRGSLLRLLRLTFTSLASGRSSMLVFCETIF